MQVSRTLITASNNAFVNAFRHAQKVAGGFALAMKGIGASVAKSMLPVMVALAPILGGAAIGAGIKNATDLGGRLSDVSSQTGDLVKHLHVLEQQLADNGLASGDLGKNINKMQDALGQKDGQKALVDLGLEFARIKALAPTGQFISIGRALNKISDPAKKTQLAMDLFGKAGGKLLTVFADPAFGTGSGNLLKQAELLDKNAAIFDSVSDRLGRMGNVFRGFFLGIAEQVAPALDSILEQFEKTDLVGMGRAFGKSMIDTANVLAAVYSAAGPAFRFAGAVLKASLLDASASLLNSFLAVIGEAATGFANLTGAISRWGADFLTRFSGDLFSGASAFVDFLRNSPILLIPTRLGIGLAQAATKFTISMLEGVISIGGALTFAFENVVAFFDSSLRNVFAKIVDTMKSIPGLSNLFGLGSVDTKQIREGGFKARSYEDIQAQGKFNSVSLLRPLTGLQDSLDATAAKIDGKLSGQLLGALPTISDWSQDTRSFFMGVASWVSQAPAELNRAAADAKQDVFKTGQELAKAYQQGLQTFSSKPGSGSDPSTDRRSRLFGDSWWSKPRKDFWSQPQGDFFTGGLSSNFDRATNISVGGLRPTGGLRDPGGLSIGDVRSSRTQSKAEREHAKKQAAEEAKRKEKEEQMAAMQDTADNTAELLSVTREAWGK